MHLPDKSHISKHSLAIQGLSVMQQKQNEKQMTVKRETDVLKHVTVPFNKSCATSNPFNFAGSKTRHAFYAMHNICGGTF